MLVFTVKIFLSKQSDGLVCLASLHSQCVGTCLVCMFECILIRDGQAALPCWFPRSDVQTIVNCICTVSGDFLYVFSPFLHYFSCTLTQFT